MWRRIRVYFVGVLLGILVTWMMLLRDRNLDDYLKWTPNNRVLAEFRTDSAFVPVDAFWCELKCKGFTSLDYKGLLEEGKVLFSESITQDYPRMYRIEFETKEELVLTIDFEIAEDKKKRILSVSNGKSEENCACPPLK